MRYHLIILASSKKKKVRNSCKKVEKKEFLYTVGGRLIHIATVENTMKVPQKLKIDLPHDLAILLLGIDPKEVKSAYRRDTCKI